ncbi:MAG TPA: tyrosine-protein phosphatase [Variovorax sp.]|nr:tyrosine-protein phosphatase [Variovorax sp.]
MLKKAPAFRDIGGLETIDGHRVRKGRVFRSDSLAALSRQDHDTFRRLGIRMVCDLRSEGERTRHPNSLPEDLACEQFHFGIVTDVRAGDARVFEALRRSPDAAGAQEMMLSFYRGMPQAFTPHLRQLLRRIAQGPLPLVIHCTAGKDRTGFAVAMVLSLLGVARRDIIAEYLLTGQHAVTPERLAYLTNLLTLQLGHAPQDGAVEPMLCAQARYLEAAFETVDAAYGSPTEYLRTACGVADGELEAVRQALLAPGSERDAL